MSSQSPSPQARWEQLVSAHPAPADVERPKDVLVTIREIDDDTPWSITEPQWWLDMMSYQARLYQALEANNASSQQDKQQ